MQKNVPAWQGIDTNVEKHLYYFEKYLIEHFNVPSEI